jgi:hypothetical protein
MQEDEQRLTNFVLVDPKIVREKRKAYQRDYGRNRRVKQRTLKQAAEEEREKLREEQEAQEKQRQRTECQEKESKAACKVERWEKRWAALRRAK